MAARTIATGVGTYLGVDGIWKFGMLGESVEVAPSDIDRFDRLNDSTAVVAEPAAEDSAGDKGEELKKPDGRAGLEKLLEYATGKGIEVPEGADKDAVRAHIDAHTED